MKWISAYDLRDFYNLSSFSLEYIRNKLRQLAPQMPNDIQCVLGDDNTPEFYLRDLSIDRFFELVDIKTPGWLSTKDLGNNTFFGEKVWLMPKPAVVATKLNALQLQMQNDIVHKLTRSDKRERCLRRTAIDKFCKMANIQSSEWLLPRQLGADTSIALIENALQKLQSQMPNDIQPKLTHSGKTELCLRKTAIDKFIELASPQRPQWVSARDLKRGRYNIPSSVSLDTIIYKLKELQPKMPNDIKMKNIHNSTQELCLRASLATIFVTQLFKPGSQIDTNDYATDITDAQMDEIASRLATQKIATSNADDVIIAELERAAKSNLATKRKQSVLERGASVVSTIADANDAKNKILCTKINQNTDQR